MMLQDTFDQFIDFKRLQGLAETSLNCYRSFVSPFLDMTGHTKEITAITEEDIHKYISSLFEREISKSTRATYVRHLKCFLNWIKKYLDIDLFTNRIIVPKSNKKVLRIYDDDDIALIFRTISAENEWLTARNCAIVALMLDSGLRQGEVCDLLTENIYFHKAMLKVRGKGDKERIVPLGKIAMLYMKKYSELCPFHSEYFFLSRRGEVITRDSVKHLMWKLAQKLPFEFSSHKLRHNFATNYCIDQYEKHGFVDIYKLMILMGHEDVKTTNRYLHIANQIIVSRESVSHIDRIFQQIQGVS
jgi:site-specific recombinase XerD